MFADPAAMRRRALIARAPSFDAAQLARIAAASPDLAVVEDGRRSALAGLGLTTKAVDWFVAPDTARIDADLRWLAASGATLLVSCDSNYPALLLHAPDPPPALFVRGDVAHLAEPQIAIVGSRSCTAGGRATARTFGAWFVRAGITITSGLALGIDGAAHEGALDAGGPTVAVLGCSLDRCYPPEHAALAERVVRAGALVSEFPPGTAPRPGLFPQRNRIIAGLSLGTVVVEAAQASGSLITARLAGVAGREVFALPGSIHNEMVRGCHELIRQGAKLVERPEDVLSELKISLVDQLVGTPDSAGKKLPGLDKAYKILLDALAFEPASVDTLIERTGMSSESIASMLLILELDGHVAPQPGGRYIRMAGPASTSTA